MIHPSWADRSMIGLSDGDGVNGHHRVEPAGSARRLRNLFLEGSNGLGVRMKSLIFQVLRFELSESLAERGSPVS